MTIENRMSEKLRSAHGELRDFEHRFIEIVVGEVAHVSSAKKRHQFFDLVVGACFIERNSNSMRAEGAEIHPDPIRPFDEVATQRLAELNPDRVEEIVVRDLETELAQTLGQLGSGAMNALSNRPQPSWAVINRVHGRNNGQEDLSRTNIACGFVPADVLLAGLQGQAISWPALSIMRDSDEASRKMAFKLISRCHVGGMRSTKTEGNAESLR